jgi:hypothetical protein
MCLHLDYLDQLQSNDNRARPRCKQTWFLGNIFAGKKALVENKQAGIYVVPEYIILNHQCIGADD